MRYEDWIVFLQDMRHLRDEIKYITKSYPKENMPHDISRSLQEIAGHVQNAITYTEEYYAWTEKSRQA